jgi:hypothetical protein
MSVRQADAEAVQMARFNHGPNLAQLGHLELWHEAQQGQRFAAIFQRPQGKLGSNEGMEHNLALLEELVQVGVTSAKIVNPNGSVRENQL